MSYIRIGYGQAMKGLKKIGTFLNPGQMGNAR